tara:strand:+ start:976 stop:1281 length:306 start_codon:yes stop_codon:yes gene_type:complete
MKKFQKFIFLSVVVSILNVAVYVAPNRQGSESIWELLFIISFSIILYNIFILIIPTIIYLISKSMTAFKVSFFIIWGFFTIVVLAFFASPKNWIEILNLNS